VKALVLSGGKGTRLRPLTYTGAKQLVPIANKPVLFYALDDIVACGIDQIGIVVGDTGEQIREAVGDGSRFGAHITYIEQDEPAGLAHAVKISRDYLGAHPFVMYLGDNFVQGGIRPYREHFEASGANAGVLLRAVPNPESFGIAEVENGKLARLTEKPKAPRSNLALVGIYFFDVSVMRAVDSIQPSARGELEITDALSWLLDNGFKVSHQELTGWWVDTGKMEDLLEANRLVLAEVKSRVDGVVVDSTVQGHVVVELGAEVRDSTLRGPLVIGRNARINGSYIGPFTAIGDECTVRNSEIEHSIVMSGTQILDVPRRLDESLIGRDVTITAASARPTAWRVMLGDHSKVAVP
jgi:glucose-1-phosphate thymidylyltransferase